MKNRTIKIEVSLSWMQTKISETLEIDIPENCSEEIKNDIIKAEFHEWIFNEINAGWDEVEEP